MRPRLPRTSRRRAAAAWLCRLATLLAFAASTVGIAAGRPAAGCCCGEDSRASGNCCCVKSARKSCCAKSASQSCCGERGRRGHDDEEERRPALGPCSCGDAPSASVLVNSDPRLGGVAPRLAGSAGLDRLMPPAPLPCPARSIAPETPPPESAVA